MLGLSDTPTCTGPLIVYLVADPHLGLSPGILECGCCGWWELFGAQPDQRHSDTPVILA